MRAFLGAFLGALVGRRGLKGIGAALFALYVIGFVVVRWLLEHPWVSALLAIGAAVWLVNKADRGPRLHLPVGPRRQCALYRFYDARDLLLYVGIAYDPDARWRQHLADPGKGHWIWRATPKHNGRREVQWFGSRAEAKAAETAAIRNESPLFNVSEARTYDVG